MKEILHNHKYVYDLKGNPFNNNMRVYEKKCIL